MSSFRFILGEINLTLYKNLNGMENIVKPIKIMKNEKTRMPTYLYPSIKYKIKSHQFKSQIH